MDADRYMTLDVFRSITKGTDRRDRGRTAAEVLRSRLGELKDRIATDAPLDAEAKEEISGVLSELTRDFEARQQWEQCVASGRSDCGECPGTCPVNGEDDPHAPVNDKGDDDQLGDDGLADDDLAELGDAELDDDDIFNIAAIGTARKQGDDATPDEILARYRSPDGSPADDRDAARAEILDRYRAMTAARRRPLQVSRGGSPAILRINFGLYVTIGSGR